MSSIAEVFPHDDPVARFVVAMGMARNDVEHATIAAGQANDNDDPAFSYLVRVAMGHTFEAVRALQHWRQVPEVRRFLARLPRDANRALARATGMAQRIGGGAAEHARDRTFHYPYPSPQFNPSMDDELSEVLKRSADENADITRVGGELTRIRLAFADTVALKLVFAKHKPLGDPKLLAQMVEARNASIAFVRFADRLLALYMDERGLIVS